MQNDHIPKPSFPTTPDVKVPKVRPGKRLEKPNVNVRRRAIRETAQVNRITPKRLAKHMKRHPDAPITQAIGALQ